MSTDKTWFEERLRSNLYLDICLRIAIWLVIAFLAIAYTGHQTGFTPISPLQNGMNNLMPVVADVMRVALVLCFLALLLKDLEYVSPSKWGQETTIGRLGGAVRRLAGDFSLWIIGALVTVLAALLYFSVFIHTHNAWTPEIKTFSVFVGLFLSTAIIVFSVVSVHVRRKLSLVSSHRKFAETFNSSWKVLGFYIFLIIVVLVSGA